MSKGEHRQFTAEQKLEILREAEQAGVTVSAVCRRHALAPSVFYRWRAVADNGSATALKSEAKQRSRRTMSRRGTKPRSNGYGPWWRRSRRRIWS